MCHKGGIIRTGNIKKRGMLFLRLHLEKKEILKNDKRQGEGIFHEELFLLTVKFVILKSFMGGWHDAG